MSEIKMSAPNEAAVEAEALHKAEEYIEEEEGAANKLRGVLAAFVTAVAVTVSAFHLYTAYAIVPTQTLRPLHVAMMLFLSFLVFPVAKRFRHRVMWWDWLMALAPIVIVAYMLHGGDDFMDRNTMPEGWDIVFGLALMLLILDAMRRTSGWVMPIVTMSFLAYALAGPWLPAPWTHKGYEIGRLVGHMYMTLEGIFGTAVDVSSSLIILFTIYGAFLQHSGAGKFYIDFSFSAMGGKPTSAGRTVVLASFLLGGPSGSGVATTVTIGSVAYPMLAKVGYGKNAAGGLLAAGGLGAIISPPVLGAAAFLIAEFLKISYLDVLLMAVIPTCLYYLALFLMVELDARRIGMREVSFGRATSMWTLTKNYGFHFLSLFAIVVFMLFGFSPVMSVFWATVVSFATSFLHRDCALLSYDWLRGREPFFKGFGRSGFVKAMEGGTLGVLNVAVTCAGAGMIVGVVTLTGLGLKFSSIVLAYAGGSLLLTALYTALIVWIVGLAVPVTASYIICAVIAAPALIQLGVPDFAAHMFIFYYAVLSEVSPPTALSPFAAAAITGGDPYKTTLQCWKYTMPAFLLPFMFVLDPSGQGLLLMGSTKKLAGADWGSIAEVAFTAAIGIAALAAGLQGWVIRRTSAIERAMLIGAGLLLVYPAKWADATGLALVVVALALQWLRRDRPASAAS
jgi:TRAP transporter 4TM/12TM fusion protein